MTQTQVTAGLALLKKIMADKTHNEHSGPDGAPLIGQINLVAKDPDGS